MSGCRAAVTATPDRDLVTGRSSHDCVRGFRLTCHLAIHSDVLRAGDGRAVQEWGQTATGMPSGRSG